MIAIGSLFSGIGGLELGLECAFAEAGIPHRVDWQVEIDPFCRSVLARHWPAADRSVTDVRAATSLPRVDLICGGFPCQDVSSAGKGAGLAGERSGLWFAYRDVVAALGPGVVVVENVASGKRRWLCRVRSDLHALGYRTRALQLGAHDVGAPHRRERIFVVAYAEREQLWEQSWRRSGTDRGIASEPRDARASVADSNGAVSGRIGWVLDEERSPFRNHAGGRCGPELGDSRESRREGADGRWVREERHGLVAESDGRNGQAQSVVGRGSHGLPGGLDRCLPERWPAARGEAQAAWESPRTVSDREPSRRARLRALGNAVVPAQAREIGRELIASIGGAP